MSQTRMTPAMIALVLLQAAALLSCAARGPYGFDVKYHPLKKEKPFYGAFEEMNYEEVKSDPMKYRGAKLGWFGTVKDFTENKDGTMTVLLEYRKYHERHLCEDQLDKSSCRVTVAQKVLGTFTSTIKPEPEDLEGKNRINFKSLLRIYGTSTGEYNDDGGPVLTCDYYRQWPAGAYVTTDAAEYMKQ